MRKRFSRSAKILIAIFFIAGAIFAQPVAPGIGGAAGVTTTSFTATWGSVANASNYYLDVATDAGFTNIVGGILNLDAKNTYSYTISGLTPATQYYWRVRVFAQYLTYDVNGNPLFWSWGMSGYSGTGTVPTISLAPSNAPASLLTTTSFDANWIAPTGVVAGYYLDVATDAAFTSLVAGYNNKNVTNVTSSTVSGLSAGTTYYWRLRAYNAGGTSVSSSSSVIVTIPNPPTFATPPPAFAPASTITTTGFAANWIAPAGVVAGYYLDVATDAAFTSFLPGYNNKDVGNVATANVSGLSAGTIYYWRLRAYNAGGTSLSSSSNVTITIPDSPTFATPPPAYAPASSITTTSFAANWIPSKGAAGYYFDVATDAAFTAFLPGYNNKDVGNVVTSNVSGLVSGTNYFWRLRAYNISGTSVSSTSIVTITIPDQPTFARQPNDPILSKTPTSFLTIWNASRGASGYYLDVSSDPTFTVNFANGFNNKNIGNVTQFNVTELSPGILYYFRLRAYNISGTSINSDVLQVITKTFPPTTLSALNVTSESFLANWSVSEGATGYYLDVATDASFKNFVAGYNKKDVLKTLSYSLTGLTPGTTYYFRVISHNIVNDYSENSIAVSTTTLLSTPASSATNITSVSFTANWNAIAGASGYFIDLASDAAFTSLVDGYNNKDVGNVITYTIAGLNSNTTYYFRVKANGTGITSSYSNTTSAITSPSAPTMANPAITNVTPLSFTANWNAVPGATGYCFDLATDAAFTSFITNYNSKDVGNVTSYTAVGLNTATQYYFRVRAYNLTGPGINSIATSATTAPSVPTLVNPAITNITPVSFIVNWNSVQGATGYSFDLASDASFTNFVTVYSNKNVGNVTAYTLTGLTPNTLYFFRVRATNIGGASNNSASTSVTTLVNVAAVLTNVEAAPISYTSKLSSVQISNTIEVRDNVHPSLTSATVSIAGNFNAVQDVLVFTDQNGITGTWDATSGSMKLKGSATPAVYQNALRTMQYKNTSSTPTILDRTISFTVNDGFDNSNIQSRSIKFVLTGIENDLALGIPTKLELAQSFPNPFNPTTNIRFGLPKESKVSLRIFNILGQEVATLINKVMPAGFHTINFDAKNLASGIYIYRIDSDNLALVKKMLLMK